METKVKVSGDSKRAKVLHIKSNASANNTFGAVHNCSSLLRPALGNLNDSLGGATSGLWGHDPEFAILSFLIFLGKNVKHIQYDQEAKAWCLAVHKTHCHMFFIVCFPQIKPFLS